MTEQVQEIRIDQLRGVQRSSLPGEGQRRAPGPLRQHPGIRRPVAPAGPAHRGRLRDHLRPPAKGGGAEAGAGQAPSAGAG